MKKFIKNTLLISLIAVVAFVVINHLYRMHVVNFGTMGDKKNDSAYISEVPYDIQVCTFGNSHGYYALNYKDYEQEYNCFNFALPSQVFSYDYRILQQYKDHIAPGAVVMICISHNSFFGRDEIDSPEFTSKNKRYYHFLHKEYVKEYDAFTDICVNYLPSLTSPTLNDLVMTTIGLNQGEDFWSRMSSEQDLEMNGHLRYEYFIGRNIDNFGRMIINEEEIEALYEIISLCREIGATPVLFTPPYLSEYLDTIEIRKPLFFLSFYKIISQVCEDTGIEYYDYQYDSRFAGQYSMFMNTDHLNIGGATYFTKVLFDDIVEKK